MSKFKWSKFDIDIERISQSPRVYIVLTICVSLVIIMMVVEFIIRSKKLRGREHMERSLSQTETTELVISYEMNREGKELCSLLSSGRLSDFNVGLLYSMALGMLASDNPPVNQAEDKVEQLEDQDTDQRYLTIPNDKATIDQKREHFEKQMYDEASVALSDKPCGFLIDLDIDLTEAKPIPVAFEGLQEEQSGYGSYASRTSLTNGKFAVQNGTDFQLFAQCKNLQQLQERSNSKCLVQFRFNIKGAYFLPYPQNYRITFRSEFYETLPSDWKGGVEFNHS